MGKKYIIELESGTHIFVLGPEGIVHIGEPDVVYETVDGMQIGDAVINAKPYAEPDLGALAKENFERGYRQRKAEDEKEIQEVYQRGLSDAWEAARKIQDTGGNLNWWIHNVSAPEAIEKIRQYEQEKEEQIQVGDEVEDGVANIIVLEINEDGTVYGFDDEGSIIHATPRKKTGRHFPEIAEVLAKMKESE